MTTLVSHSHSKKTLFILFLAMVCSGQVFAQQSSNEQDGGKVFWIPFLAATLSNIQTSSSSSIGGQVSNTLGNLFARLLKPINDWATGATSQPAQNNFNAPAAPLTPEQLQQLAQKPLVTLEVEKFSDSSDGATSYGKQKLVQNSTGEGQQLSFFIKTGEAFALSYATSLPGRVRLTNFDAQNVQADLGTYEVLPHADNRMPRKRKGIKVIGTPGMERIELFFTPCVSPQLASDPRVAPYQSVLPACTQESAIKQYMPSAKGGFQIISAKGMPIGGKGAVNEEVTDSSQPIMAASDNYTKGTPLPLTIFMDHQATDNQQVNPNPFISSFPGQN